MVVDLQALLRQGSAVQIAAADSGVISDANRNILGRPWQTLVAQAPDAGATVDSKTSAAPIPIAQGADISGVGSMVALVAGLAVALGAGQGGGSSQSGDAGEQSQNTAPSFTSGGSVPFAENDNGAVYTAQATPHAGGAVSYSISGGADSAQFSIDSSSGVVSFVSSPNHESPTDSGSNNGYDLVIRATEVGNTVVATRSVTVIVQDVGDVAPGIHQRQQCQLCRKRHGCGLYRSGCVRCDRCGGVVQHQRRCRLGPIQHQQQQRVVRFVSSPNFEAPTDSGGNNVYDIVVEATEAGNAVVATRSVAVTVLNVAEAAPTFSSGNSASFTENATGAVYTAVAVSDVMGRSISYSISGTDSARFSINSSSGVLSFVGGPNHESATDVGGNNVYDIVIRATEVGNTFVATRSVAVTVTDVGDVAPTFTSANSISASFAENDTGAVYTAQATPDVTGAAVSYSISGGLDSARFSIDSSSGVVRFISVPDFETPADSDSNNSYQFVVSATEAGNTFVATRSLTVTVSNVVVEGPVFSSASSASFAENATGAVYTAVANPIASGASVSYSISGGADSAKFSINSSGVVSFVSSPNHESPTDSGSNNVYNLEVKATEAGNTNTTTHSVAVTVTDVGDVAPSFTSASSASFVENATGAAYTAVAVSDVTGAAVSYSISGGADSAKFSINSSSGVVRFVSSPDFDTLSDADSNNVYDIVITATEANNTNTVTQSVAVTVTDVGDVAPVFSSASSATFAENATGAVYTAVAVSDVVGASISFSISGGADSAKFSINSSGVVSFVSSPNHESATDVGGNNVYDIVIRATEAGNTHTVTQSVAVTVTDVGDVAPVFTSANSASFAENGNGAVYTAVATPDVTGAVVSYSISGGLDSARFSIDSSSGVVSFVSVPDFEIPADSDSNNSYQFVVSATEAGNTFVATRSLTVTVSNVVVEGSTFTSASSASFVENATGAVYTAVANPIASGASVSYSISGGADSAKFSINSSGVVSFVSSPNHESPTDSGSNNVYNLEVKATEAGNTNTTTHSVAVTVTDVGDVAPSFTSASSASFVENATGAAYTAVAVSDVTGAAVSYSISGGADSAKFSINSSSGVMRFVSSPDFDTLSDADSNNVYDIVITATEANNTNTVTQSVAVTVTDVGDVAPVFSSASSATFAENATGAVYTAVAVSDVMGASISFSISGGADSAKFSINSSSGCVGFVSSPNHESATDVGGTMFMTSSSEPPRLVTPIPSPKACGDGDRCGRCGPGLHQRQQHLCQLCRERYRGGLYRSGHPRCDWCSGVVQHQRRVRLGPIQHRQQQRVVRFVSSPNHESPTDADSNNSYQFVVSATEAGNTFVSTRSLTVTVSDVGDVAPVFTSASSASFVENANRCGLYRSGRVRCHRCGGVIQHQRWCRLGQIQHQQQQRGGALCQQPRL